MMTVHCSHVSVLGLGIGSGLRFTEPLDVPLRKEDSQVCDRRPCSWTEPEPHEGVRVRQVRCAHAGHGEATNVRE